MEMIKKIGVLLIVITMSFSVISCEGCNQNNPTSPEETKQQ